MKILHFTNFYPDLHKTIGGAEQAAQKIVELLNKNNENLVITTKFDYSQKNIYNYKIFSLKTSGDFFKNKQIKQYIFALKILFFPFDFLVYFKLKKILPKIKPTIIYLHHFDLLTFAIAVVAKKLKIPTVLSVYDYWYFCPKETLTLKDESQCQYFQSGKCMQCYSLGKIKILKYFFYIRRPLFNFFLKFIDKFVVLSNHSKNLLLNYGIKKKKITLIPLPYKIKIPEIKPQKNTLLFVGWLQPRKGLHIIIAAMGKVIKKHPQLKLKIIGIPSDENYQKEILKQIDKLKIKNNIIWMKSINNPQKMFTEITKSILVVVPEQWANMQPLIIIESMLLKKIIVASNIGGIPELIKPQKTGLLAVYNSPEDFAQKIIWAFENLKDAEKLGSNAYNVALNKFAPKNILQKFERLFTKLIS